MSGLEFQTSITGVNAYANRFKSHSQNLTSLGAVAGKEFETYLTAFDSTYQVHGVDMTRMRHLQGVGAPIQSQINTHLSIAGQGWAPIRAQTTGGNVGYTRDGSFNMDNVGNFINNNGHYLQIFKTDTDGVPLNGDVYTTNQLTTLNVKDIVSLNKATESLGLGLQLPANAADNATHEIPVPVYDSLGNRHYLTSHFQKVAGGGNNQWNFWVTGGAGVVIPAEYQQNRIRLDFNNEGQLTQLHDIQNNAAFDPLPNLAVQWGNAAANSDIAINFGELGTINGVSSLGDQFRIKNIAQDGHAFGEFQRLSWDEHGFGTVHCTNGDHFIYCRIPLATFNNTNALLEEQTGFFMPNRDTGSYRLNFSKEGDAGFFVPEHLEGSTTDSTSVYVKMIEDQKRFTGNLKAIESIKQMLDRLQQI
ncbi:MAG: flagellar hook-basal body complex protein [Alphaproteobacteria bacterium]